MIFSFISSYGTLFFKGTLVTIKLWLAAAVLSFSFGTVLGICQARRLRSKLLGRFIALTTYVLRAIPVYVQVLVVYFVFPDLTGINLSPFAASAIALGCCSAAYVAEFVRGGIDAIGQGQWEGAQALGFSQYQILSYVILPQVLAIIYPSFSNELEALLKSTSIFSTIGVLELTKVASSIVARDMNPLPVFLVVSICYLILSTLLLFFMYLVRTKVLH